MNLHSKDINQAKTGTSAVKKPAVAEIAHTGQEIQISPLV